MKLKSARVAVIGAGGLGCPLLQALVGAGVGHLAVMDGDRVAISNVSRQWLHVYGDAGRNKAESAVDRLKELNPFVSLQAYPEMLTVGNAHRLIEDFDVVVDATDDIEVRYLIDQICAELEKPWVHAALYRERSQLCVFWAKYGARFSDLFPEKSEAPSCAGAGMLGAAASVVANLQALEVIKLVTGSAPPQLGRLLYFDTDRLLVECFTLPGVSLPEIKCEESDSSLAWSMDQLEQARSIHLPYRLVDIRTQPDRVTGDPEMLELSAESILEYGLPDSVSKQDVVVLVCEEGSISRLLAEALRARGSPNLYYLKGGVETLRE